MANEHVDVSNAIIAAKKQPAYERSWEIGKKAKRDYVYKTHETHLQSERT